MNDFDVYGHYFVYNLCMYANKIVNSCCVYSIEQSVTSAVINQNVNTYI